MFNITTFPGSIWPVDLMSAFGEQWFVLQKLYDSHVASVSSPILLEWSMLVHSLVGYCSTSYEEILSRIGHNLHITVTSAFILIICLLTTNLLLLRQLRREQRISSAETAKFKQLLEEYQQERQVSAKLKDEIRTEAQSISQLRSKLAQTELDFSKQRNIVVSQSKQIQTLKHDLNSQKVHAQNLTAAATKRNASLKTANATVVKLQADVLSFKTTVSAQTGQIKAHIQEISGLKIENELLQAIDGRVPTTSRFDRDTFSAFAAPFVLVVVDGDAYSWSTSHFDQPGLSAGRHAAHAIKIEVQRYLLQNRSRVPLHAKIVTRVFTNLGDSPHMKSASVTFPRHFSESMPLFDFVNCGGGKERADSKIQGKREHHFVIVLTVQELFHLFVANEQCYTIFFAAATDNGFARLLEQYACIPAAKEKIVLVEPGFVAHEIQDLGYKTVRWTTVFRHKMMNPESRAKEARIKLRRKHDSAVLEAIAARELVKRLFDGAVLNSSATDVGLSKTRMIRLRTGG